MEKGVWRTINGRKVFIEEGQSARDAVTKSLEHVTKPKKESKSEYDTVYEKLKNVEDKISKLETRSKDKTIDYDGREIKVTGIPDDNPEVDKLIQEANGYRKQLTKLGSEERIKNARQINVKSDIKNETQEKKTGGFINNLLRRKAYQKYLKEHPSSNMKFEEFIDMYSIKK